ATGIPVVVKNVWALQNYERHAQFDARAFALALTLGVVTATLAAIIPAWLAGGLDAAAGLRESSLQTTRGRSATNSQRALIVLQVACGMLLLTGATILAKDVLKLATFNPGFDPNRVLQASFAPRSSTGDSGGRARAA